MKQTVTLKLYAGLRKFTPETAEDYPITPGVSVREIMNSLGVPPDKPLLVFIAGNRYQSDVALYGGEVVKIFPPMGGG